jgi:exonuclease III
MKIMFCNIRGFGSSARRQIKEYIKEEGLDVVGLQETISEGFTQKELEELAREQFSWV